MFSQSQNAQICAICNGTSFYKDSGIYYCTQCQTQNDDIIEKVFDNEFDTSINIKKKTIKKVEAKDTDVVGWTSWELYNFVMIGLTNELYEIKSANENISIDPNIKLTILQLWTYYLSKLEVAFTSKTKKCVPRIARRFYKRDVEIIYGKIKKRKRKRKKRRSSNTTASSSSFHMSSDQSVSTKELKRNAKVLASEQSSHQTSSDADGHSSVNLSLHSLNSNLSQTSSTAVRIHFNKKARLENKKVKKMSEKVPKAKRANYKRTYVTSQYAASPDIVTPLKLWSIIYLALRIHNHDIQISDMLRFSREGHLSYYKLDHLLPPEVTLTKSDINLLTQNVDITHKGLRKTVASMAKFLGIKKISKPDLLGLIKRYCEDLALPMGIYLYAQKIFLSHPPQMEFEENTTLIPNYEGRAIAFIIVVLKILFSLDDVTEKQISRVVEKINRIARDKELDTSKLFSFCEWQNYIECRKDILAKLHYSSKLQHDPERTGTSHLYLRFMGYMKSKRNIDTQHAEDFGKGLINENLVSSLYQCLDKLNDMNDMLPMKEMEIFPPSLTPSYSYLNQLLENTQYHIPSILCINFSDTKIGYMTRPERLIELAKLCGIDIEVSDHSLQFFEKIVPPFEQPRFPSDKELSEVIKIPISNKNVSEKYKSLLDYAHRNRLCALKVNFKSLNIFSLICDKMNAESSEDVDDSLNLEDDCFFDKVLPDGRLDIGNDNSDCENETTSTPSNKKPNQWTDNKCLLNEEFNEKYNIKLYKHEKEFLLNGALAKEKSTPRRDKKSGKFIKKLDVNKKITKKKEFKRIVKSEDLSSDENSQDTKLKKKVNAKKKNELSSENESDNEVSEIPIDCFDFNDSDISVLEDMSQTKNLNPEENLNVKEIILRPYKDYWMYHCIFSRVKGKNFDLFEKELPENFLWLLNECANVVEMTIEDLYEEICLIEAYHFILSSEKSEPQSDYKFHDCSSKLFSTNTLKKW